MKQIIFLFLSFFISLSAFSQKATEIFNEDFSSGVPPTGWTIDNLSQQWSQSDSENAGGSAPEAKLSWTSGTQTTRLISPEVDLSGISTVVFSFKHFLNDYSGSGYSIGVATRSGGGSWNDVWSVSPGGDIGPEVRDILISNDDVGATDFQVCIYLSGNMYNFDYWYIDDAILVHPDENDASVQSIDMSPYAEAGDVIVNCTINNKGLTEINTIDINYQVDDGTVITENLTGLNIATTESLSHSFSTPWAATSGNYLLKVWVSNMNGIGDDDDTSNDMQTMNISIATQSTQNLPLFEEFTSSTCAPCASFNSSVFTPFMNAHPDDIAVVKYQMSWPAPGDDYYTEEGGVRRFYYGVSGVPALFTGGVSTGTNSGSVNAAFNYESSKPSFFDMTSNFTIDGDMIDINVDIMPYISVDMTVHIVVIENETTGNVGNNGETSFRNVMMKMLPDAEGTAVNFTTETNSNLTASFDMSSTFVEEMDDLAVVVFIQNDVTKEVMQSINATKGGLDLESDLLKAISVYPNPAKQVLYIENAEGLHISLYDMLGRSILTKNNILLKESIQTDQMTEGTYFLKLSDGVNVVTKKIFISK